MLKDAVDSATFTAAKSTSLDVTIRVMLAIVDSINMGKDFSYLKKGIVPMYRSSLIEFLMTDSVHPVGRKYPDSMKVVMAYRTIEDYINQINKIKPIPSNP